MTAIRSAAVVGLGLIGGSIARDLAARQVHVIGADRDHDTVEAALGEGVISASFGRDFEGLAEVDVVVIAVPVDAAASLLREIAPQCRAARVVMDVGSSKRSIVQAAQSTDVATRFVGAHPYAGDHRCGWRASRQRLFEGAAVFLVPGQVTSESAVAAARELWLSIGGVPELAEAVEHDRRLAMTSHLPHIVANALANALAARGLARSSLGAGGEAMTRLAGSSPEVWTAICADNAVYIRAALDDLRTQLEAVAKALGESELTEVEQFFNAARRWSAEGGLNSAPAGVRTARRVELRDA